MRKLLREEARDLLDILPGYAIPKRLEDAFPEEFSIERPCVEEPTPPVYRFFWDMRPCEVLREIYGTWQGRAIVPASLVTSAAVEISGADKALGDQMMASYGFEPGDMNDPCLTNAGWEANPFLHVTFRWTYRGRDITVLVPEALVVHAIRIGKEKLSRKVDASGDDPR